MSITVEEKFDSRETVEGESVELLYTISGTDDDAAAMAALRAAAPGGHSGMVLGNCRIEYLGPQMWLGLAPYSPSQLVPFERPQTGDSSYSFDTGGGTQHVTQSIQTVGSYAPPGKTAPDFKGAIGATLDSVEGVDITVPIYQFSETHYLADSVVTLAYRGKLFRLTARTNNAEFRGLAAGECLFLGASGSQRGGGDWEITFRFAASPNKTDLAVGDITVAGKKGWQYLWVRYADAVDPVAKAPVKKPQAAYVEKVYDEGNYADLGI